MPPAAPATSADASEVVETSPLLVAIVAAVFTFLVFLPACTFAFLAYDDNWNITQNPYLNPQATVDGFLHFWRSAFYGLYMPVTYSVWVACAALPSRLSHPAPVLGAGYTTLQAPVFHTVGILAHVVNVALVFAILRLLLPRLGLSDPRGRAAALGALLFGVHPVQVESVAWVTGHNNVYSGLFALAAIYAYLRAAAGSRPILPLLIATILYCLALLAKPTATAVPLLLIILELTILRRRPRLWLPVCLLWLLLGAGMALLTNRVAGHSGDYVVPIWQRPFVAGDALAFYVGKLLCPAVLCNEYPRPIQTVVSSWWGYVTWIIPALIIVLLVRAGSAAYRAGFGIFVVAVLPMLGFIPYYFQPISTVADRYLYLGLLGPALILAALIARWQSAPPLGIVRARGYTIAVGVVLALYALRTVTYVPVWRNTETLLLHTLAVSPDDGTCLFDEGNVELERHDWPAAIARYRACLALNPKRAEVWTNLGIALASTPDHAATADALVQAATLHPRDDQSQLLAAAACRIAGRKDDSLFYLHRALALSPHRKDALRLSAQWEKASPSPPVTVLQRGSAQ